jgi:hypothetical protein
MIQWETTMKTPILLILALIWPALGALADQPAPWERLRPADITEIQGTVVGHYRNAIVVKTHEAPQIDHRHRDIGINLPGVGRQSPYRAAPYNRRVLILRHPGYDEFQPGQTVTLYGTAWPVPIQIDGTDHPAYRWISPTHMPRHHDS